MGLINFGGFSSNWNISLYRYIGQSLDDLIPFITLVVALHVVIVGFIYMLSKIFGVRSLRITLNTEVQSVITSIAIFVIVITLNALIPSLTNAYVSTINDYPQYYYSPATFTWSPYENINDIPSNSHYINDNGKCIVKGAGSTCNSLMFLARMYPGVVYYQLTGYLTNLSEDYSYFQSFDYLGPSITSSFNVGGRPMGFSGYFSPNINGLYRMFLTDLISDTQKIMFIDKFIEMVLLFIEKGLGVFLIGFGLAFRAAPLLKRLGAFMIALGIVFMYIFPALMALTWITFPVVDLPSDINQFPLDNDELDFVGDMYRSLFLTSSLALYTGIIGAAESLSTLFVAIYTSLFTLFGYQMSDVLAHKPILSFSLFTDFSNNLPGTFDYLAKFYLEGLAIPLFNLYIAFSLVKGLSSFFGGYFEIPGLARLI